MSVTDQELLDELIELLSSKYETAVIEKRCNELATEQAKRLNTSWTLSLDDEDDRPMFWAPEDKTRAYGEHSLVAFDVAHGGWCIPSWSDGPIYMTPFEVIAHVEDEI